MLAFLIGLSGDDVPVKEIRDGRHPLAHLYRGVTTKTLSRDIHYLEEAGLVMVLEGVVKANLGAMQRFTALSAER